MTVRDSKYVVFKKADWEAYMARPASQVEEPPRAVQDAVVIRTQDIFAGPALHSYAASIAVAASIGKELDPEQHPQFRDLQVIADYFHERALEADASMNQKVPTL